VSCLLLLVLLLLPLLLQLVVVVVVVMVDVVIQVVVVILIDRNVRKRYTSAIQHTPLCCVHWLLQNWSLVESCRCELWIWSWLWMLWWTGNDHSVTDHSCLCCSCADHLPVASSIALVWVMAMRCADPLQYVVSLVPSLQRKRNG